MPGHSRLKNGVASLAVSRASTSLWIYDVHALTEASLPGLTRQSITSKKMDARIKSAHDNGWFCQKLE